jgi:hypothetical protein
MSKRKELKVGDLVRLVKGDGLGWHDCSHANGAVGEVTAWPNVHGNVDVCIKGLVQGVDRKCVRLATQAMKKRDAYEARRV